MDNVTKWWGWLAFGLILMLLLGAFKILAGIFGLFTNEWLVQGTEGYSLVDATGLAIWWIVSGVVLILGAVAVTKGKTWGRIVGIVAVGAALISELFELPNHPLWSVLLIVAFVFILISFVVVRLPAQADGSGD
jgi:uncharacterized membrane protein HdeD (DUF308 family)